MQGVDSLHVLLVRSLKKKKTMLQFTILWLSESTRQPTYPRHCTHAKAWNFDGIFSAKTSLNACHWDCVFELHDQACNSPQFHPQPTMAGYQHLPRCPRVDHHPWGFPPIVLTLILDLAANCSSQLSTLVGGIRV